MTDVRDLPTQLEDDAKCHLDAAADDGSGSRITAFLERQAAKELRSLREELEWATKGLIEWRTMAVAGIAKQKALRELLRKARKEVEYWTPDESNADAYEVEALNGWYALRDQIDDELKGEA
jgi:tetraacyldisaccharide-1-P 4'-kinase